MTKEELELVEARTAGKRGAIHEEDNPMPKARVVKRPDGSEIKQVGNFQAAPVFGDSQTLKKFARIESDTSDWVRMSNDEALLYQDLRVLIGHDGDKKLGWIDHRKLDKIKKEAQQGTLPDHLAQVLEQLEGNK